MKGRTRHADTAPKNPSGSGGPLLPRRLRSARGLGSPPSPDDSEPPSAAELGRSPACLKPAAAAGAAQSARPRQPPRGPTLPPRRPARPRPYPYPHADAAAPPGPPRLTAFPRGFRRLLPADGPAALYMRRGAAPGPGNSEGASGPGSRRKAPAARMRRTTKGR